MRREVAGNSKVQTSVIRRVHMPKLRTGQEDPFTLAHVSRREVAALAAGDADIRRSDLDAGERGHHLEKYPLEWDRGGLCGLLDAP
ncbi:hypothetical protein ACWD4T_46975, partial [Streptomyces umbrinus]